MPGGRWSWSPRRNASFTIRKNQPPAMDSIPFHTSPCAAAGPSNCQNVRDAFQPAILQWEVPAAAQGLELAAILMIFTAQAWNLALSFYNSLKGLPAPGST